MLQNYPNTQLFLDGEWRDSVSKETLLAEHFTSFL